MISECGHPVGPDDDVCDACFSAANPALKMADAEALEAITALLSGVAWSADTINAIADAVRATGRYVSEVGGVTYEVCDVCAQALVNGDTSSDDLDVEAFEEFVADHGPMVRVCENRRAGYWDCEVCAQAQIGSGHLFEAVS